MNKNYLLTYTIKNGGSSFMWFDTEEELLWTVKNVTSIIPMEAIHIKDAEPINLK